MSRVGTSIVLMPPTGAGAASSGVVQGLVWTCERVPRSNHQGHCNSNEEEEERYQLVYYTPFLDETHDMRHTRALISSSIQPIHIATAATVDPNVVSLCFEGLESTDDDSNEKRKDEAPWHYHDSFFTTSPPSKSDLDRMSSLLSSLSHGTPSSNSAWRLLSTEHQKLLRTALAFHIHIYGPLPSPGSTALCATPRPIPSALAIDDAAAAALHLWPPSNNIGHAQFVGGNSTNHSIYSIFATQCVTPLGPPRLRLWLQQPLIQLYDISARQDAVQFWVERHAAREALRTQGLAPWKGIQLHKTAATLTHYASLLLSHDSNNQSEEEVVEHAKPKDDTKGGGGWNTRKALIALYHLYLISTQKAPILTELLQSALAEEALELSSSSSVLLAQCAHSLQQCTQELQRAGDLVAAVMDLEQAPREYVVRANYKAELQDIQDDLARVQQELQAHHEEINLSWSQVAGTPSGNDVRLEAVGDATTAEAWQFRLTDTNHSKILQTGPWKGRVTVHKILKNGVYFTTPTLRQLSQQQADLRREQDVHQRQVVQDAIPVAATYAPVLLRLAEGIAPLDVLVALAQVAAHSPTGPYCRPEVTDSDQPGAGIHLVQARHPCVERQDAVDFIPNDYHLVFGESNFLIVTGPNMGGKSTYIRALGAIVTMAQIGAFVPCTSATINICHHILTRVGAGDQQDRGISTFMAEMLESSAILQTATKRSLIIIDELGRGTSTFDGYGLAKAIAEYMVQSIGCITVFATHFHELTVLEEEEPSVRNCHVTAQNGDHGLTFLYAIQPGPCLESFGIQVAEMAQVPSSVVQDAKRRARRLEHWDRHGGPAQRRRMDNTGDDEEGDDAAAAWMQRFRQLPIPDLLSKSFASEDEKRLAFLNMLQQEAA